MTLPGFSHSRTITKWLWLFCHSAICASLLQPCLRWPRCKELWKKRCCCIHGFVSDHFWLLLGKHTSQLFAAGLVLLAPESSTQREKRRRFSCFQDQLYSCNPNLFCPFDDKKPLKGFHLRSSYKLHFLQVLLKSLTVTPYISILSSCHCSLRLTVVLF